MKSLKTVLIFAVLAVMLASCSTIKDELGFSSQDGLTFNKQSVSESTLDSDLKAIGKNKTLVELLKGGETPLVKDGKVTDTYRASWANIQMQILAIKEARIAHKQKLNKADRKAGLSQAKALFSSGDPTKEDAIWNDFPKAFQDRLTDGFAEQTALLRAAPKPTQKEIQAYFDKNKDSLTKCESGKTVAHILVKTEKEAKDIKKQIDGGASFAKLAKDKSIDTGSAVSGGDLGCYTPDSFVAEFEAAVKSAALGAVSAPVKSQYGYHIIKVSAFEIPTLKSLTPTIITALEPEKQSKITDAIQKDLKKAKVTVLKKYGKVLRTDGVPSIVTLATKAKATNPDTTAPSQDTTTTTAA